MFVVLMGWLGCAKSQHVEATSVPNHASIHFVQEFRGRIFSRKQLVPQNSIPEKNTLTIRTQEEFDQFIARIPAKIIQKKQPAPPSEDPLRTQTHFDSQYMMLVSMRFDNNYAYAPISKIEKSPEAIHVWYSVPPLGESAMYASMSGVGTYHAILIPAEETQVVFHEEKE